MIRGGSNLCLKPIGTPTARNPYQTWCQSRHPSPLEDLHFGSHHRETHCVSPNSHSLFFLILPISVTKPTDSFSPQNPSPSPSSFYLPIWMPLMLSSGKWGPWLSMVILYFDNEVESTLFWNLDFTSKFLKMWFLKIWIFRNVVINMIDFIGNILRYIECEIIMFGLFLGILNELFIFLILSLDLNINYQIL